MSFSIKVSRKVNKNRVVIYKDGAVLHTFICSVGIGDKTTLGDNFKIGAQQGKPARDRWRLLNGGVYGQYISRFNGSILFHSVPYYSKSLSDLEYNEYLKLGTAASAGCVRMCVRDAKWIYDNCPDGTEVTVVDNEDLGDDYTDVGLDKFREAVADNNEKCHWDPTDPDDNNPWGDQFTGEFGGNPYPFIVDENGNFIDSVYPNLASPEFIKYGRSITVGGSTIYGTNNYNGRTEIGNRTFNGVYFPSGTLTLPNCTAFVDARWQQLGAEPSTLAGLHNAGTWYTDPKFSGYEKGIEPKLGAIACWKNDSAGHVAVVERILDDGSFYTSNSGWGDSGTLNKRIAWNSANQRRGVCIEKSIKKGSGGYSGWVRGGTFQGFIYFPGDFANTSTPIWEELFAEPVERTDATIRSVGYLSSSACKPTLDKSKSTGMGVAAINYTPTLQAIYNYEGLGWNGSAYGMDSPFSENITNSDFDTDGCAGLYKRQDVVTCLLNLGFSRVQVAGICGNIFQESTYRPWSVEGDYERGTVSWENRYTGMDTSDEVEEIKNKKANETKWGIGLLAWTWPSFEISMVAYCEQAGKPWYGTVEQQLTFFAKVQLGDDPWRYGDYPVKDGKINKVLPAIQGFPNTEQGARDCCEAFMRKYESPKESSAYLKKRQDEAAFVFNNIIPYQKRDGNNTGSVSGGSGTRKAETR